MKKTIWLLVGTFLLAGCAAGQPAADTSPNLTSAQAVATAATAAADLPDLGAAPELTNDVWINTDQPLRLADLRGKVVLLEMWTFGCINCQHVIPSLKDWYSTYHDQGLVIIANHYPEFSFEKDLDNLKQAVADEDIRYAVTQDNDGATWRAYDNHFWPSLYLIDKDGHIRYTHVGEGSYATTEAAIQKLLAEPGPIS